MTTHNRTPGSRRGRSTGSALAEPAGPPDNPDRPAPVTAGGTPGTRGGRTTLGPRARMLIGAAAAIAAGWLVSLGAGALRLDWVLPILLVPATASVLRAGRTVLDRLVLAIGLLAGVTCVAGLLLSVWPWHLQPVPVAGCAFTGLALVAALLGRRPEFPRTFRRADAALLGFWLGCVAIIGLPLIGSNLAIRLGYVLGGEDLARHYMIYDGIRAAGGYVFLNHAHAPFVVDGYATYPQGTHMIFALLENFVRSSTAADQPLVSLDHMTWFFLFSYAFLGISVLWAIRWVAGTTVSGWIALPVLGLAFGYLMFSDPTNMLYNGYPSEVVGLALVTLALALLARPLSLSRTREQLVLAGVLIIGVSFTYYFWLPVLACAAVVWMVRYRRRLLRPQYRITTAVMLLVTLVFGLVTPVVNAHANNAAQLQLRGGAAMMNRTIVETLVLLVIAALILRTVRRLPVWTTYAAQLAAGLVFMLAIYVFQRITVGHSIYYFEKALHGILVLALLGLGAVAMMLRPVLVADHGSPRPAILTSATLAMAAVLMFAGAQPHVTSNGMRYVLRIAGNPKGADEVIWAYQHLKPEPGRFTMVFATRSPNNNFRATLFYAVLERNYAAALPGYVWMYPVKHSFADTKVQKYITQYHTPVRVVLANDKAVTAYQKYFAQHPELHTQILNAKKLPRLPSNR